jgi:hypothetical protein
VKAAAALSGKGLRERCCCQKRLVRRDSRSEIACLPRWFVAENLFEMLLFGPVDDVCRSAAAGILIA